MLHKPITIIIQLCVQRSCAGTVRDILRSKLIDRIEEHSEYCISGDRKTAYNETCRLNGLTRLDIEIDLSMVIDKHLLLTKTGGCLSWFVKPLCKTAYVINRIESEIYYVIKRILRNVDPIGLGVSIQNIQITS